MRDLIILPALAVITIGCSALPELELPPIPGPPADWSKFSLSRIPGSECPLIEGVYTEPPEVHRSGKERKYLPPDNMGLYGGYIPLHRADRKVLLAGELNISKNSFVIRQSDPGHFYLLQLNHQATEISEYLFRSDEGDFECRAGHIEFPILTSYGFMEGGSTNFQVRNVLFKDKTGALVIQSSRGPYRGSPSRLKNNISYEFFRYSLKAD